MQRAGAQAGVRGNTTLGDGFAPGDRLREIDPDGDGSGRWSHTVGSTGTAGSPGTAGTTGTTGTPRTTHPSGTAPASGARPHAAAGGTDVDAAPALPTAARGRRFVRSTSGGEAYDPLAHAPAPAAPLEWKQPERRADAYTEPSRTPLRGRKAERAHRELLEARRRAEEERAAAEADVESRGAAGFRDANRHAARVAMSNPGYTPSAMYEQGAPAAPQRGKPWYARLAVIIPVAIVLVAGLFAGIGLPAIAQANATAAADRAASEFEQQLVEYRSAWTTTNLAALTAAQPHLGIGDSAAALVQPLASQTTLTDECTVLTAATRAANELADNPPPTLAVLPSASFSTAYRDAQAADAAIASERLAGQTLLGAITAALGPLGQFCTNFQAGVAIENQAALRDQQELAPLRTISAGGTSVIDGRTIPCTDPRGCVNLGDEAARASYAAAWRSIDEERALALVAHYRDACWLDVLQPYCSGMSEAWNEWKGGISAVASSLASEKPARDPSQGDFPRLTQALTEQATAFTEVADQAALKAGEVDPAVLVDQQPGWETRMLVRLVTAYETHLEVAVQEYRTAVGA